MGRRKEDTENYRELNTVRSSSSKKGSYALYAAVYIQPTGKHPCISSDPVDYSLGGSEKE